MKSEEQVYNTAMAVPEEDTPRLRLIHDMLKSIYPAYIVERRPYRMAALRIHIDHSLQLILVMGRP